MAYRKYLPPAGYRTPKQSYSRFGYDSQLWLPAQFGKRYGLQSGGSKGVAPALFVSGQSNSGNVDTVAGSSNAGVSFTWTPDGAAFHGPGIMGNQSANTLNGHSYEWQCSTDMALAFNSPILVGKTWADGATCDQFCRVHGQPAWPLLRNMIANFAAQMRTARLTQCAFIWDQGSSEALTVNAALTPNLQTNTLSVFASIRAIFKAYGIGNVRFYVMQQNINFIGLSGINTAQLNSVRAQEAALVTADGNSVLINCDDIVMASGYHYANGQTNVIGSRFAKLIEADFVGSQPSFVTPPTLDTILGTSILSHLSSRSGISVSLGSVIPQWNDISPHGANGTSLVNQRPLYLANALGTIPGVQGDGLTSLMAIGSMTLPVPGVTPTWSWEITRPDGYTNGGRIWGGVGAAPALMTFGGSPFIQVYNGSFSGTLPSVINGFNRIEAYFSNSNTPYMDSATGVVTGDYGKVGEGVGSGTNLGNTALGNVQLFNGGAAFAPCTVLERLFCNALPNKSQFDAICGYYTFNYGTAVGIT